MTRPEWMGVLAQARGATLVRLVGMLSGAGRAEVIRPPTVGLVLVSVEESVQASRFHTGEILMTSCEVRLDNAIGYALILGKDESKAWGCALVDAALQGDCPERERILGVLRAERTALEAAHREEAELIQSTRVDFSTMDPQR